jgi:hypothetical protein
MNSILSLPDVDAFWYLNSLSVWSFASCSSNFMVGEPLAKPISQTLLDAYVRQHHHLSFWLYPYTGLLRRHL